MGFVLFACIFKLGPKPELQIVLRETLQTDIVFKGESSRKEELCGTFGLW